MRSFGKKPCTLGWNLKPRTPWSAISRRASSTPRLPLCGSMLANGMSTSALACATSAISSFGTRVCPVNDSESTVKMTAIMRRAR